MQIFEHLRDGLTTARNFQLRGNLMERDKNKCTLIEPWMRKHEAWLCDHEIVHEQNIQIQCPRPIGNRLQTIPAKLSLDRQ